MVFVVRGPVRGSRHAVDYAIVYAEARAWLAGLNPYDHRDLDRVYERGGGREDLKPVQNYTGSIQSPSLFPLAATIAWLPWPIAVAIWIAALAAAYLAACSAVGMAVGSPSWRWMATLIGIALCFAPILAGLSVGQPSVLAIALLLSAFSPPLNAYPRLSGIALGLAICTKPQLGIPFLLAILTKQRQRTLVASLITVGILALAGTVPLTMHHPGWPSTWRDNVEAVMGPGNTGDPSPADPDAWKMINLQVLLLVFFHSNTLANALTLVLVGCGGLAWWHYRRPTGEPSLGSLSLSLVAMSCLALLVGYHRNYDAGLLLFTLPAIPHLWRKGRHALALGFGCLLAPFLVPLPAFLAGYFPEWTAAGSAIPCQIALKHQVVLVAFLGAASLYAMRQEAYEQRAVTPLCEDEALTPAGDRLQA